VGGSLWACDSLGDHASTRSRLGSLHFWIWRGSRIILRHVRFRTYRYKKQLLLERMNDNGLSKVIAIYAAQGGLTTN
jgi:hypothetical protein